MDEIFGEVIGPRNCRWFAINHKGMVLEAIVTKRRNKQAASKLLRKLIKCHGDAIEIVTDQFLYCDAAHTDPAALNK